VCVCVCVCVCEVVRHWLFCKVDPSLGHRNVIKWRLNVFFKMLMVVSTEITFDHLGGECKELRGK